MTINMGVHVRIALFALLSVSAVSAQDARGWFEEYCDGAAFHLTSFAGRRDAQELTFWFRTQIPLQLYAVGTSWWDVVLCPSTEHCDESVGGKLEFLEFRKKLLSGRYVVDYKGQHREGRFMLKKRTHKHPEHLCM
jgi:hypothetical protein